MNIAQNYSTGGVSAGVKWNGVVQLQRGDVGALMRAGLIAGNSDNIRQIIEGWDIECHPADDQIILLPKKNLVVQIGVARSLDRLFQISGGSGVSPLNSLTQEVVRIGVDNGTTNPTGTSVSSNTGGGTDTGASTQTLRTFNSAATRASLVVSATGTFNDATTGGIGAVGYAMKRLFLSAHTANITNTTAADSDGTLYSMTNVFTVDFTSIATWSANFSATVTGAGT
ncbi:hypothetical protein [Sphingomonas sp.]|jgi:hypothetical protein|uniref:hypothetical protein n=1 Tax=Sphingomonas sp. TaxID=28214 RepID=UPI003565FC1C